MLVVSLQSGSNGNCYYVEAQGVRLVVDAGISGTLARQRLARRGFDIRKADGLLISHDHADHSRSIRVFHRKFGMPVFATAKTFQAVQAYQRLGPIEPMQTFEPGQVLQFGALSVRTVPTPHDAADGVVFVFDDGCRRLGILTDLGHVFPALPWLVASLDAVVLESNYDPEMLRAGPYSRFLQERIRGPRGHLSNAESAMMLRTAAAPGMRWACLAHLSETNNRPELALATHRQILEDRFPLFLAGRHEPSEVLEV
jgi:phosphoribosyl 1,2-cyclic phosphodiesterase